VVEQSGAQQMNLTPLVVSKEATATKSRLALLQVFNLNLRMMEEWRRVQIAITGQPLDYESTMVLMAITAIGGEQLIATGALRDCESLSTPVDINLLRKCNLSSIAATTGLNRELVRRRIGKLVRMGLVHREQRGGVRIAEGVMQRPELADAVTHQLRTIVNAVNRLRSTGVLRNQGQ
jgi:hypothetical protein